MNLLFSIPVHEKPEVVIDQVLNFKYFNPGCGIVIHISPVMVESEYKKICDWTKQIDDVFVNDIRVRSGLYDIIQTHLCNYEYSIKNCLKYQYFCCASSNEMFLKPGLFDFVSQYKAGLQVKLIDFGKESSFSYRAKDDSMLLNAIWEIGGQGLSDIRNSQIEGSFFEKTTFEKMYRVLKKHFDYKKVKILYAREEVYFSSLIHLLLKSEEVFQNNYTFFNKNSPIIAVHLDDIEFICNSRKPFFSAKRIIRDIDNPIRCYIRSKTPEIHYKLQEIGISCREYTYDEIESYDIAVSQEERGIKRKRRIIDNLRKIKLVRKVIDSGKYKLD